MPLKQKKKGMIDAIILLHMIDEKIIIQNFERLANIILNRCFWDPEPFNQLHYILL